MKLHKMPFEYWEDEHVKLLRNDKPKEFLDPDYYVEAHWHYDREGNGPYFLNKKGRGLLDRDGPFEGKYVDGDELLDSWSGETCYIVCPGPSLSKAPIGRIAASGRTIAVNSAGFAFDPTFWCLAESGYAKWFIEQDIPPRRAFLATARVAVWLRHKEKKSRKKLARKVYVIRWEEGKVVPPRTPAVTISNALVSAWQMGACKAVLVGLDLSKPGAPYAKGIPYTREGAQNPFNDQVRALRQFELPGFEIVNTSPHSKKLLPFDYCDIEDVIS